MRKVIGLLVLACVVWAGSVNAATITQDPGGTITGATGLDVGGTFYDVAFVEGSCNSLHNNCTDFTLTSGQGFDALTALANVLYEPIPGAVGVGRSGLPAAAFFIATNYDATGGMAIGFSIWAVGGLSVLALPAQPAALASDYDTSDYPEIIYTSWTASPVPLPAAAWLFISAIVGLTGAKRMSRSKRTA